MAETPVYKCSQCGQNNPLTPEFYGVNAASPTGFRNICKICFSENRYGDKTKAVQALRVHDRLVAKSKRELADNLANLSPGQIEKYERIVRLALEHKEELQKKILDARKAEEAAKFAQIANPALARVQAQFGSALFIAPAERKAVLEQLQTALATLTGPTDGLAREYVQSNIAELTVMLANAADRAAFLAEQEQETIDGRVSQKVIDRLMDIFLPQIRAAITAEAKISLRDKIRDRKKKLMVMAKTATGKDRSGADKAVVAKTVADALEKLALMLYSGTKAPLPSDTLGNLQSRIDAEQANAELLERAEAERRQYWDDLRESNPEQFEKESKSLVRQIKGDDYWSQMQREAARRLIRKDPVEAARLAMLALQPRNVTPKPVVYVIQEGKHETWLWPNGKPVIRGIEVTYDARMKAWCLMPGPAGVELDGPVTGRQKMELIQDPMICDSEGYPTWKWVPEGSTGIHEQQPDGTFKRTDNPTPWTRPEKIEFRKAPAHVEGSGKDHFRHGQWWSLEDVQKADAADAANPPSVLPPLPVHSVADSIAVPPRTTAADRLKDAKPLETVWGRADRLRREKAEREAALLRGEPVAV